MKIQERFNVKKEKYGSKTNDFLNSIPIEKRKRKLVLYAIIAIIVLSCFSVLLLYITDRYYTSKSYRKNINKQKTIERSTNFAPEDTIKLKENQFGKEDLK